MNGLSTNYLNTLMCQLESKTFIGCFPIDLLPSISKYNECSIIINLDESTKYGSHWISIFKNKDKASYFCSGASIPNSKIISYLKQNQITEIDYNKKKIQSIKSNFCGYYCVGFIITLENKCTFNKFMNLFYTVPNEAFEDIHNTNKITSTLLMNDKLIEYYLIEYIKMMKK